MVLNCLLHFLICQEQIVFEKERKLEEYSLHIWRWKYLRVDVNLLVLFSCDVATVTWRANLARLNLCVTRLIMGTHMGYLMDTCMYPTEVQAGRVPCALGISTIPTYRKIFWMYNCTNGYLLLSYWLYPRKPAEHPEEFLSTKSQYQSKAHHHLW